MYSHSSATITIINVREVSLSLQAPPLGNHRSIFCLCRFASSEHSYKSKPALSYPVLSSVLLICSRYTWPAVRHFRGLSTCSTPGSNRLSFGGRGQLRVVCPLFLVLRLSLGILLWTNRHLVPQCTRHCTLLLQHKLTTLLYILSTPQTPSRYCSRRPGSIFCQVLLLPHVSISSSLSPNLLELSPKSPQPTLSYRVLSTVLLICNGYIRPALGHFRGLRGTQCRPRQSLNLGQMANWSLSSFWWTCFFFSF